jgi:hypothetical protein
MEKQPPPDITYSFAFEKDVYAIFETQYEAMRQMPKKVKGSVDLPYAIFLRSQSEIFRLGDVVRVEVPRNASAGTSLHSFEIIELLKNLDYDSESESYALVINVKLKAIDLNLIDEAIRNQIDWALEYA